MAYEVHKLPAAAAITGEEFIGISQRKAPKKITINQLLENATGGGVTARGIDGGFPDSLFLSSQAIEGGNPYSIYL